MNNKTKIAIGIVVVALLAFLSYTSVRDSRAIVANNLKIQELMKNQETFALYVAISSQFLNQSTENAFSQFAEQKVQEYVNAQK